MRGGGGTETALRTRNPARQLNLVGWDEEDLSNLLSPNSLVSAASGRLRPSTPAFQVPDKYFRGVAAGQMFEKRLNAHRSVTASEIHAQHPSERSVLLMTDHRHSLHPLSSCCPLSPRPGQE